MIGGNTTAEIQIGIHEYNAIGEKITKWEIVQTIKGWLDLQGGNSTYATYNAKMQESTHVFVADYVPLTESIKAENCRIVVEGKRFDVMLIDDPMGLHKQWEIYLKHTGG